MPRDPCWPGRARRSGAYLVPARSHAIAAWAWNSVADARLPEIVAEMHGAVAEGVFTTEAALGLAHRNGVEIPIMQQMYEILQNGKLPKTAIQELIGAARQERGN